MIRGFQRALSQLQLNFGAFGRAAAPGFGSISHISQSRGQVFLHPACPAKGACTACPALGRESRKQRSRSQSKIRSRQRFSNLPNGGDAEGAAWQMGPLGVRRFVTPYKASQSNRRARSLPAPGDGSGRTLARSQHPPPCGEGGRAILVPAVATGASLPSSPPESSRIPRGTLHTRTAGAEPAKGYLWCQREVIEAEASAKRDIL